MSRNAENDIAPVSATKRHLFDDRIGKSAGLWGNQMKAIFAYGAVFFSPSAMAATAMLVLMSKGSHAAETSTFKQVSYQGQHRIAEEVDGSSILNGDILAFSDEISDARAMTSSMIQLPPVDVPSAGTFRPWRKTRLSYSFDEAVPQSVRSLLKHGDELWEQSTSWQFVEATAEYLATLITHTNSLLFHY